MGESKLMPRAGFDGASEHGGDLAKGGAHRHAPRAGGETREVDRGRVLVKLERGRRCEGGRVRGAVVSRGRCLRGRRYGGGCALTRSDSRRSQAVPWCFIRTTAKAQARIQATGRGCRVEWYRDGDPADELKRWLMERSAIREFDGGATREDADRAHGGTY